VTTSARIPVRALAALAVVTAALVAPATTAQAASRVLTARDASEPILVQRINNLRTARGLRRLRVSRRLTSAATRHANSLALDAYFRHELLTPARAVDWTPYGRWIHWYYPGPDYTIWSAGENLAWGAPDLTPRATVRAGMNSLPHRENLLRAGWRQIGVAIVHITNPGGAYRPFADVTIVAAEFGIRR
jgi:uncharacterized protein YkwD